MPESPSYSFMSGCNPLAQQARQDFIDTLYAQDGRHDPGHPLHGTYTALWGLYVGLRLSLIHI